MRTTGPRCRICRRVNEKLFLKGDRCMSENCPVTQGLPVPGDLKMKHPKGKPSQYKLQLTERQKVRKSYDINEGTLHNYYDKALGKGGKTGDLILQMLELRLDNVIYRAGFAAGRPQARQFTTHGHFLVNGRRVDIPSYQVRVDDVITLRENSQKSKIFTGIKPKSAVRWLKVDPKRLEITILAKPEEEDLSDNFNIQAVVESYSR